jgi:transcriptional regulator with XRE-family HTH domain
MPKTKVIITKLEVERRRKGWTRSELARRADLNSSTVSGLENGKLKAYEIQLNKLGQALGIAKSKWAQLQENALAD